MFLKKCTFKDLLAHYFQKNCVFIIKGGGIKYFVLAELKGRYLNIFINFG